jgi:HlyD family secretion protein
MRTVVAIIGVICLAVAGAVYYATHATADAASNFRTVAIKRDDLLSTITATGTVQAEERVDVGAQVNGMIKSLGIDPGDPEKKRTVDYCSVVHQGTVLARIDDAVYNAQVKQAEASLQRAKADLLQLQARLLQTEQEWRRAETLRPAKAIADTDYDLAFANYKAAKANLAVGEALIMQNQAALELARTNLAYTVITSPVEGTIIDRRVDVGQTVVASLNAPSLFLIAKDLRRIQVWASVNEADIGRIRIGMPVQFTVDAYPSLSFRGKVTQIRLAATITQNVVTYTVVVVTDNTDGKLLPYMTANVSFEVENRPKVLLVPNAALRWKPRPAQIDPEYRKAAKSQTAGQGTKDRTDVGSLWIAHEGVVRPLQVTIGSTDGSMTEISGSGVKEGLELVIGEGSKDETAEDMTNPFAPKLFGGKKKQ